MGNSSETKVEHPEIIEEKLSNSIKTFIANQKDNIIKIFEDESY